MLIDLERPENELLLDENAQKVTWDTSDPDLRKPDAATVDQFIVDEFKSYFVAWTRWKEVQKELTRLEIRCDVTDQEFYNYQMKKIKEVIPAMAKAIEFDDTNSVKRGAKLQWDAFFSLCRARNFVMAAEMINNSKSKKFDLEQIKYEFDQWVMDPGEQIWTTPQLWRH